ncbi:IS30 family transposase [Francisella sp. TX07-6608]|uniref:IS30 family transposase n=1 Tax=Francisella sp. TX07-6608 TaxID=573568 RepID=UPI0008F9DF98|nr:IS30 family transposase [Francisella sp. TX07-6608]OIN85011.1 integrase core domain protein [Francisella sp. TX07-6608]
MKKYKQLSYEELVKIETLLSSGYDAKEIAIKLARDKSCIYRCVKKNSIDGKFIANVAYEKIRERKLKSNKPRRILPGSILSKYVVEKIEEYWSPEQIANVWKESQKEPLSHETIYQYVYKHRPELVKIYFRRKGKKYQHDWKSKHQILNRRMINERPDDVELKHEVGHWEGDTIIGKDHKGAITTNVERKSGKLIASKLPNKTAQAILDATKDDFADLPTQLCVSITYDNGKEFAMHEDIEKSTGMTVYFARAYASWQRGTNENTNGLLRQFIPKGTDFGTVSDQNLERYVNLLNNRPRKRLNWKSPNQVFQEELNSVALESGI